MGVCSAYKASKDSSAQEGAPLASCSLLSCAFVMGEFPAQVHFTPVWCWAQMRPHGVSMQRHRG